MHWSLPPPTLTPTPTAEILAVLSDEEPGVAGQTANTSLVAALPAPGLDDDGPIEPASFDNSAPAEIPPVTMATVLRPERILWLFIIGLIIFTVTYGIQVVIWYRLRR